ncbi:hypothetical protein [Maridesulfovibrio frigidus]|uniref:hypothetical protein n=1 Tax=Maridesulfovibrio frigidus TaxID=340956 RepID=UPI0004E0BEC1|nr:hypothetical protein [Maridesulfovibrio frigidus]
MSNQDDSLTELFDKSGNLIGALLTAELWTKVKPHILPLLPKAEPEERPEPMSAWVELKQYWDFSYPIDLDVKCDHCGSTTEHWEIDSPRKFRLVSANLGGLVSFKCSECKSRITKQHFKDKIVTKCTPFIDEKDKNFEARYNYSNK